MIDIPIGVPHTLPDGRVIVAVDDWRDCCDCILWDDGCESGDLTCHFMARGDDKSIIFYSVHDARAAEAISEFTEHKDLCDYREAADTVICTIFGMPSDPEHDTIKGLSEDEQLCAMSMKGKEP